MLFFLIPGRKSLGGYAVDSQNKEMLENDREKYSGVYRGVVFFLFPFINLWSNLSRLEFFESAEGHMHTGLYYKVKIIKEMQFKNTKI